MSTDSLLQQPCKQVPITLFFVWPRADDRWPSLNCHQGNFMEHPARVYGGALWPALQTLPPAPWKCSSPLPHFALAGLCWPCSLPYHQESMLPQHRKISLIRRGARDCRHSWAPHRELCLDTFGQSWKPQFLEHSAIQTGSSNSRMCFYFRCLLYMWVDFFTLAETKCQE